MAVEPLRPVNESHDRSKRKAPPQPELTVVPTTYSEVAAENQGAVIETQELVRQKAIQIARELCTDPAMKNGAAWEHMVLLLRNQFDETSETTFRLSDPQTETGAVTSGDITNAFFNRRRDHFVKLCAALQVTPDRARKKAVQDELTRFSRIKDQMSRYYSVDQIRMRKKYLDYVDGVFANSSQELQLKTIPPRAKRK